jgi:hypothetical protein
MMFDESTILSHSEILIADAKFAAAEELLFLIIESNNLSHQAYYLQGKCFANQGNLGAAISCLETACLIAEQTEPASLTDGRYANYLSEIKVRFQAPAVETELAMLAGIESTVDHVPNSPPPIELEGGGLGSMEEARKHVPGIFINTLPKSGNEFFIQTICNTLNIPQVHTSPGYFPSDHVRVDGLFELKNTGGMSQNHLNTSSFNLTYLSETLDRWILHIRDPRQATFSWAHHMRYYFEMGKWTHPMPLYPDWYFEAAFEKQLDWLLAHHLPDCIEWIENWLAVYDSGEHEILLTTYDELVRDDIGLVKKMIGYFGIDVPREDIFVMEKTVANNFRRGDPEEWKFILTAEQREYADSTIPQSILHRFGWQ